MRVLDEALECFGLRIYSSGRRVYVCTYVGASEEHEALAPIDPVGLTKNDEPLLAPLGDAALARLQIITRMADNPCIICGRDPAKHLSGLGRALGRVLKRAGLENIRIHDLRRTVGSRLAQDGKSLHLIGDVLNHRDPKTTADYAYFQTQQRREALTNHADNASAGRTPA